MAKDKNAAKPAGEPAKCPITRAQFAAGAKPLAAVINGETKSLTPKDFVTGSMGWFANEKMTVIIDGVPVKVQANLMLTVVGSKELAK